MSHEPRKLDPFRTYGMYPRKDSRMPQNLDYLRQHGQTNECEDDKRLKLMSSRGDLQEWNEFIRWMKIDILGKETKDYSLSVHQYTTSDADISDDVKKSCPHISKRGNQSDETNNIFEVYAPDDVHIISEGIKFYQLMEYELGDQFGAINIGFVFTIDKSEMGFLSISYVCGYEEDDDDDDDDDDEEEDATIRATDIKNKAMWEKGIYHAMETIRQKEREAVTIMEKKYPPENTFQKYHLILEVMQSAVWPLRSPFAVQYLHDCIINVNKYDPYEGIE